MVLPSYFQYLTIRQFTKKICSRQWLPLPAASLDWTLSSQHLNFHEAKYINPTLVITRSKIPSFCLEHIGNGGRAWS